MSKVRPETFPVPPAVVATIVQRAADPKTSLNDLAGILSKDAVLTAQVLKTVNSASYGLKHQVCSVDRAVGYLGIRGLRNLVLCIGMRSIVSSDTMKDFPLDTFWESSLRRAGAARCIAGLLGLPGPDEFFTRGLCQDIGLLVRLGQERELAEAMKANLNEGSDHRLKIEREHGEGHDELGFEMFTEWNFPPELTVPVRFHHHPDDAPEDHREAARVGWVAEAVADLSGAPDPCAATEVAAERIESLGLHVDVLRPMIGNVNELVREFSEILGINIGMQPEPEDVLRFAMQGLEEINNSYDVLARGLQDALRTQKEIADELREHNQALAHEARTDALTSLANRRAFEESLSRALAIVERQQATISLLMLDVDHFKRINDAHGHAMGDRVLQHVASLLCPQLRAADIPARYGGEEFSVILPFTDKAGALIAAERIRQAIECGTVELAGNNVSVAVSIGGATFDMTTSDGLKTAPRLVELADEALYAAKRNGRNQVCWS